MMDSIAPECTDNKNEYDKCFMDWFSKGYLKGDTELPTSCGHLFEKYQECLKQKLMGKLELNDE